MPKVQKGLQYAKKYSEAEIQTALKAIVEGMPLREAARKFNIPRATLQFRKGDKFVKTGFGPNPVLTKEEEDMLEKWIIELGKKGFPRRKEDIQLSVQTFLEKHPRKNPFTNNFPNDTWYKAFLRRHPNLVQRTAEMVTSASSNLSENDLRKWFRDTKSYLQAKGYDSILSDPRRVLNGDETCFNVCPKNTKVLAPRGTKNIYEIEHASSKLNITVMFTFSASGMTTPPMIIFPGKRLKDQIYKSVPQDWGIGMSESGWMKAHVFYEYISKVLFPYLKEKKVPFPVILFIDGHKTHLTYEVSDLCRKLEIILICLYPNSTRILQPADVAAFRPIKVGWKAAVLDWRRKGNLNTTLTKEKFAPILQEVVNTYAKSATIQNGFRATGLYPFDENAVDYSKCLGKNNSTESKETPIQEKYFDDKKGSLISYQTFEEIVGKDIISKFEKYEEDNSHSKEFTLLYEIWMQFDNKRDKSQNSNENLSKELNTLLRDGDTNKEIFEDKETINADGDIEYQNINNLKEIIDDNCIDQHIKMLTKRINEDTNSEGIDIKKPVSEEQLNHDHVQYYDIENLPIVLDTSESNILIQEVTFDSGAIGEVTVKSVDINESSSLSEILYWPNTPKRKATRQTKKVPYVITGTEWRENKRKEVEEKVKKEAEKEERLKKKRKQALLKLEKEQEKEERKKSKISKQQTTARSNRTKVTRNKKKKDSNTEPMNENFETPNFHFEPVNLLHLTPEKINKVTKNLFQEKSINILSNILIKPNDNVDLNVILQETGLSQELNIKKITGLCFSCTFNCTVSNYGIKCHTCDRSYHVRCLKKYNIHKSTSSVFHCLICVKNVAVI